MNDLYGIDPDAPENPRDLADLLRLFRSGEGRFIAACPHNWPAVIVRSDRWTDSQRHRVIAFSEQIKRVIIPLNRREVPTSIWSETALRLQSSGVKSLLGVDGCAAPIVPLHVALEDPDAFSDARGDHIPRQTVDYVRAVQPLFKLSTKVVLVDPFFGLWRKKRNGDVVPDRHRRDVLTALLKCAALFGRVVCFKIMLSEVALPDDPDGVNFVREYSRIAKVAGAGGVELLYEVLEDRDEGNQHARYLLGNYAGLQFDHGFAIDSRHDGKSKNHVHWMSESELTPLLDRFMVENA
jgi:hypothetical protein